MLYVLLALPLVLAGCFAVVQNRTAIFGINAVGGITVAGTALAVAFTGFTRGPVAGLSGLIYIDALSVFMISIVAIVGLVAALYSISYLTYELENGEVPAGKLKWYFFWFYIFMFTMLSAVTVNNLGLMWVAIEGTTIASALLVGFYEKKSALEAAWKYIIICTVGIIFALFGTILLYYTSVDVLGEGSVALNWESLVQVAGQLNPKLVKISFVFILVGFGTKAGLAPMHTWLPDAHSQAPSPVSALLSGVLLNCALYGIIRFHLIVSASVGPDFSERLLLIFGLLSVAVSLPFMLVQHDIKRLLAYSSIEHIGIIAAAVGLGGRLGLYGAFLHMLNHALVKSSLFFSAGVVTQKFHTKKIGRIKGALRLLPISGPILLLGMFAITGMPPFGIFISEFAILSSAFAKNQYIPAGLLLAMIIAVFAGLLYSVSNMVFGSPPGRSSAGEISQWSGIIAAAPLLVALILGAFIPAFVDEALWQVVSVMTGGN